MVRSKTRKSTRSISASSWFKGSRAAEFDAARPPPMAPTAPIQQPRPATTRYPISTQDFDLLKSKTRQHARGALKGLITVRDSARTAVTAPLGVSAPAIQGVNVDGIAATGMEPPDCTCAAGTDHLVIAVNATVAIHDKATGAQKVQRTLTQWFGPIAAGLMLFDPKACFDQFENRFVLVAMGRETNSKRSIILLSVSKTADPTAGWFNYAFDATKDGSTKLNMWADYRCLGLDPLAIYITNNMFTWGDAFTYTKLRIINKADAYAGKAPRFSDLSKLRDSGGYSFTVVPCQTFGAPGSFNLVNSIFPTTANPVSNSLVLWTLVDPLGKPKLTSTPINVTAYSVPSEARQQGGTLKSGDVRVQNAVFRSGSIWTTLGTAQAFGSSAPTAAVRWYQIEAATGKLLQEGAFGSASADYFYPAIQPDGNNGVDVFFCASTPTTFGSLGVASRVPTDPAGKLGNSRSVMNGVSAYNGGRWGDYNGIANDPVSGGTVWCYGVYGGAANAWATRLASV